MRWNASQATVLARTDWTGEHRDNIRRKLVDMRGLLKANTKVIKPLEASLARLHRQRAELIRAIGEAENNDSV